MSGETTYSSYLTYAAEIESGMPTIFRTDSLMASLISRHNINMPGTRSKTLPKAGSIVASVVPEAVSAVPQVLSQGSTTLTLQKAVVVTKPTIEAIKFAGASEEEHRSAEQAACLKKFDQDTLALSAGFSQEVDTGTTMTLESLEAGAYAIRAGDIPEDRLNAVLSLKQATQISAGIRTATGAFYGNPNFNPQAGNATRAKRGFYGEIFGVDVYESLNTAIDTAQTPDDYIGMIYSPDWAIAALFPSGDAPEFESAVSTDSGLGILESVFYILTRMWYQVGEYYDGAGVRIRTDI